jgi:hypothetical protein
LEQADMKGSITNTVRIRMLPISVNNFFFFIFLLLFSALFL